MMPKFTTDEAVMYFDYEKDDGVLTIQIVEGRLGPNAVITLMGDELHKLLKYVDDSQKCGHIKRT